MSFEDFLAHVFESVENVEDNDLVIHRLTRQPLAWNMAMVHSQLHHENDTVKVRFI